jgi:hypothetical protein
MKPNFRAAVRRNKCSGKMFGQTFQSMSGAGESGLIVNRWQVNYCSQCDTVKNLRLVYELCSECLDSPSEESKKDIHEINKKYGILSN